MFSAERKSTTNESNIEGSVFIFITKRKKREFLFLEEEQITTTRQAKSKALETLSIGHNKRRIDPESDLNEEQEDTRKRTSSLSRRVSTTLRHRRRSEKFSHSKTFKRQRQSSSEEEEEDNRLKSKRNSAPIFSHRNRRKKSDSEPQSEGTDTGNLCVRRGAGTKFIQMKIFSIQISTRRTRT